MDATITKIQRLFDSADELLNQGRIEKDSDKIARSDRVFNIAQGMLAEHGLSREMVRNGRYYEMVITSN